VSGLILLSVLLAICAPAAADTSEAIPSPAEIRQTWQDLPQDQQPAYVATILAQLGQEQAAPNAFGATCEDALIEPGQGLPVLISNSTAGVVDDYQYGTACGGDIFNDFSGIGADRAHLLMVDHDCRVKVSMQSSPGVDLSLFVTSDCDDVNEETCIGSDMVGEGGVESVEFDAESFSPIYIVVDGFAGGAGSYVMAIREADDSPTHCGLVPVELQRFTIE
jgi:hypothetical protein